ncbi:bacteriocin [Legionella jamestowniensis]|uniref:Uncharacterized protein n=1 Tax=Legionella jamestowniensis TaxID=455 RepID=A0A0W0UWG6_9GAMM|nr:bacteriocin [Legionella jamestowniensis]KTD12197.1 hypothetical protein Ljam_0312 [Legionella jamestowniensis]SFM02773.1 bacteriocin-type signal sequence-containing protein [Legionella jamestowniensis DSM 19215]
MKESKTTSKVSTNKLTKNKLKNVSGGMTDEYRDKREKEQNEVLKGQGPKPKDI